MSQSVPALAPTLSVIDGTPTTTSNEVAQHFGKEHAKVLRSIELLIETNRATFGGVDFNAHNFTAIEYTDAKGERRPAYRLTRDGFTLLAMGFTGKRALTFKLAYIEAFNRMEAQLAGRPIKPATQAYLTVIDAAGAPTVYPASAIPRLLYSDNSPFSQQDAAHIVTMATQRMRAEALTLKQATGYGDVQNQVKALTTFQLGTLAEFAFSELFGRFANELPYPTQPNKEA
jgi:Rha family phage regulatory protein